MPGRNLSEQEKRLLTFWEHPPRNLRRPLLRAIEVAGTNGLRSLDSVRIPFNYPITALCGKNGTGKSTVLALTALAFHSPPNWYVPWTNARYRSTVRSENRSYHLFQDFFVYGRNEQPPQNVQITWRHFINGAETSVEFRKSGIRWGNYSRRPERELAYSPLSRVIPALEINSVRGAFKEPRANVHTFQFNSEYRGYLAYIMGVSYRDVEVQQTERLSFPNCETALRYSAFNMGGGENCVVALLKYLMDLPPGGLLIVEEIESCLHPEAQIRLAEILVTVSRKKNLQIVCSTHSQVFLDALPRQARLLLTRDQGRSAVVEGPSTRFATYQMTGQVQPELTIYCEDQTAAVLIEEAVGYDDRQRLRIIDVGSNATVVKQAVCHLRAQFPGNCLCVLDGDCSQRDVEGWIASERAVNEHIDPLFEILPGNDLPPERWVLEQLAHEDYRNQFAEQLGCRRDQAREHVTAMGVELDHHDISHTLENRTGFDKTECTRRIMRSVARNHPALDVLKARISRLLG
jgi:predicted ATPase